MINPVIQPTKIAVLFQSEDLVIVDKPAGMHCSSLRPESALPDDTVFSLLASDYPEIKQVGRSDKPLDGLMVNRLDQGTSGLLVFARNRGGFLGAVEAIGAKRATQNKAMQKDYLCWVEGQCQWQGVVTLELAHSPKSKKRMIVLAPHQINEKHWVAKSSIVPIFCVGSYSLVWVRIHTGVTHQIRLTMAYLGHHVLGDPIYKSESKPDRYGKFCREKASQIGVDPHVLAQELSQCRSGPKRELIPAHGFFLHAWQLKGSALLPEKGIIAPLPSWF